MNPQEMMVEAPVNQMTSDMLNDPYGQVLEQYGNPWLRVATNRTALYSALMSGGEVLDRVDRMVDEYTRTGESATLRSSLNQYIDQQDAINEQSIDMIISTQGDEQAAAALSNLGIMINNKYAGVHDLIEQDVIAAEPIRTLSDQELMDRRLYAIEDQVRARESLDNVANMLTWLKEDDNYVGKGIRAAADATGIALIPGWGMKMTQVISEVAPGITELTDNVLAGEGLQRFYDYYHSLPPAQQVEINDRLYDALVEDLGQLPFIKTNSQDINFLERKLLAMELVSNLGSTRSQMQTNRVLENIFGVADIIPVLGGTLRGIKGWRNSRVLNVSATSTIGDLSDLSPTTAANVAATVIRNPVSDDLNDALQATREGVVNSSLMPQPISIPINIIPDANTVLGREVLSRDLGFLLDPATRARKADAIEERLATAAENMPVTVLNQSRVTENPTGGLDYMVTISGASNKAFSNSEEALNAARLVVGNDEAEVILYSRVPGTGEYRPLSKAEADLVELRYTDRLREIERNYSASSTRKQPRTQRVRDKLMELNTPRTGAGQGEFVAVIKGHHRWSPDDADFLDGVITGANGRVASYLDKDSYLAEWASMAGSISDHRFMRIKDQMATIMKPFYDLRTEPQERVLQALVDSERNGEWFNRDQLNEIFKGDETLIAGYQAVHRHQDTVYDLVNHRFYETAKREGWSNIRITRAEGDEVQMMGRAFSEEELAEEVGRIKTIYDPNSDSIRAVTRADIDAIIANGDSIGVTRRAHRRQAEGSDVIESTSYTIIPKSNGVVEELPYNILNKRGGYISRFYDTVHIVKERVRVSHNGGEVTDSWVPVRMARSAREAERYVMEAARQDPSIDRQVFRAREISENKEDWEYANGLTFDYWEDHGRMYTGKRGEEIRDVNEESNLIPIMDSIKIARTNAARHAALDPTIETFARYLDNTYADDFNGGKPIRLDTKEPPAFPQNMPESRRKDYNDMIALRDHIRMLMGVTESQTREFTQRVMLSLGDALTSSSLKMDAFGDNNILAKLTGAIGAGFHKSAKGDPFRMIKNINFTRYIVFNMARQFLLNANQMTILMGVKGGAKYTFSGRSAKDFTAITIGTIFRDAAPGTTARKLYDEMRPKVSRTLGMSVDEYDDLVDDFMRSGFVESIDSHHFIDSFVKDQRSHAGYQGVHYAGRRIMDGGEYLVSLARKIGFDAGEFVNAGMSYLYARNTFRELNGRLPKTQLEKDWVAGKGRQYTLNMTSAGRMRWQDGALSIPLQFMSHVQKTAQLLIPVNPITNAIGLSKFANKAFSNAEKRNIALQQLALYGTGAFGLNTLYDEIMAQFGADLPPEANMAIKEGLMGTALNMALWVADEDGERSMVEISQAYAPLSGAVTGNVLAKLVDTFLLHPVDLNEFFLGASGSTIKDIHNAYKYASFVGGMVELPEESDQVEIVMEEVFRLMPFMNNYLRGRAALAYEEFYTAAGNPTVRATKMEALAKMLFGTRSHTEADMSNYLRSMRGAMIVSEEGSTQQVQSAANDIYNNIMRLTRRIGEDTGEGVTLEVAANLMEQQALAYKAILPDNEYFYIFQQYIPRRLLQEMKGSETKLTEGVLRGISNGTLGLEDTRNRIQQMTPFQGQEELLNFLNSRITDLEVRTGRPYSDRMILDNEGDN